MLHVRGLDAKNVSAHVVMHDACQPTSYVTGLKTAPSTEDSATLLYGYAFSDVMWPDCQGSKHVVGEKVVRVVDTFGVDEIAGLTQCGKQPFNLNPSSLRSIADDVGSHAQDRVHVTFVRL